MLETSTNDFIAVIILIITNIIMITSDGIIYININHLIQVEIIAEISAVELTRWKQPNKCGQKDKEK